MVHTGRHDGNQACLSTRVELNGKLGRAKYQFKGCTWRKSPGTGARTRACLELGQSALAGDPTDAPIDLSVNPVAPKVVLYRMIESLLRAGKVGDAWAICQKANGGGYLDRAETFPLLAVDYRKLRMAAAQTPIR